MARVGYKMLQNDRTGTKPALSAPAQTAACPRRIVCALLFIPLLAPFYAAILFGRPWALPLGLMLSYPSALFVGAPVVWLLLHMRWTGYWHCIAAGILCSVPAVIAYACCATPAEIEAFSIANAASLLGWGAFSGLCFWLLALAGDSPVTLRTILTAGLGDHY